MNWLAQKLPEIIAIYFLAAAESVQKDPLIDKRGETIVDLGVVLLAVSLVMAVKIISPKVEHAILLAIFLSLALITFFFIK
ncbi:hypothetical protein Osc7112_1277 [Oscillatoria nigro-viridis PCC 7112]|uniref:Uncharacterized protein n=1 Tax=Phormidium nigroviride PCC 7112 TaxID=179408 RepID=K9VEX3_9CYAN|nr:hypothetical protein [Oscillatoria nigro-viridis]AFZ05820.1 hypothetical protein Osc7112_1277 [Oscillatoria nigro-viridis PCC 7112]